MPQLHPPRLSHCTPAQEKSTFEASHSLHHAVSFVSTACNSMEPVVLSPEKRPGCAGGDVSTYSLRLRMIICEPFAMPELCIYGSCSEAIPSCEASPLFYMNTNYQPTIFLVVDNTDECKLSDRSFVKYEASPSSDLLYEYIIVCAMCDRL